MLKFLKTHSDEIASAAAILGVAVGIVGFTLTICQLRAAERALRASNVYQIQSDAREIIEGIAQDSDFRSAVMGNGVPQGKNVEIRDNLWKMHNFYLSVFRQEVAGGITEDYSNAIRKDFCGFVEKPFVSLEWDSMVREEILNASHVQMRDVWCE